MNNFTKRYDMDLVVVETPFSGDIEANMNYLDCCIYDCLRRGEGAIATHKLYTKIPFQEGNASDDRKNVLPGAGREWCCNVGIDGWARKAKRVIFYMDRGMSQGMRDALAHYRHSLPNLEIQFRRFDLSLETLKQYFDNHSDPPMAKPSLSMTIAEALIRAQSFPEVEKVSSLVVQWVAEDHSSRQDAMNAFAQLLKEKDDDPIKGLHSVDRMAFWASKIKVSEQIQNE